MNAIEGFVQSLSAIYDVVAVSANTESQLIVHLERRSISFLICLGLSIEKMQELGLYISTPRSDQETDHHFPEPGLFVVNDKGQVQVVDISKNPFVRTELETLVDGLIWMRRPDINYPVRGTHK